MLWTLVEHLKRLAPQLPKQAVQGRVQGRGNRPIANDNRKAAKCGIKRVVIVLCSGVVSLTCQQRCGMCSAERLQLPVGDQLAEQQCVNMQEYSR